MVEEALVVEEPKAAAAAEAEPMVLAPQFVTPAVNVAVSARMQVFSPAGQCNTIAPIGGADPAFTDWVSSPNTAWTAHGQDENGQACPAPTVDLNQQSAIGFDPSSAAGVPLESTFLLGRMQHRNNPIINSETISTSTLGVRIDLDNTGTPTNLGSFGWSLNETDNGCNTGPNCSDDIVTLTSSVSNATVQVNGIEYNLIIQGFTRRRWDHTSCGTSPVGSVATTWQTVEGQSNYGCLWGQLRQIRPLTIEKVGIGAADPPAFDFTSTSNRTGSFWKTSPWVLNPTGPGLGGLAARSDVIYAGNETVTVTEGDLPTGWSFTSATCVDSQGHSVGSVSGKTVTLANLPAVPDNEKAIVCTFTNTRNTGSIELKKDWVGTAGNVDLFIKKGATQIDTASANGADGTTGANTVDTGTYDLSEVFGANTSASDYTTTFACTGAAATPGGSGLARTITVAAGETVVCTFTNTRNTGSIELKKDWVGTAGNVDLFIKKGATQIDTASANGADGTTGANTVDTGTYDLSEVFGANTSASDYTTTFACTGAAATPGGSGLARTITVAAGETVVCTFTNTRNTGSIELKKDWVGTAGNVDLFIKKGATQIDTASANGADGTTGANTVDTGTYDLSEVFGANTSASDYTTTFACTGAAATPGGSGLARTITVAAGETVVCTFTNTRNTGSIELKKDWVGTAGNVDLFIKKGATQIDTASANGADGTTGANTVDTGTYDLSEVFGATRARPTTRRRSPAPVRPRPLVAPASPGPSPWPPARPSSAPSRTPAIRAPSS